MRRSRPERMRVAGHDDHRGHPAPLNDVCLPARRGLRCARPGSRTRWFVDGDLPRHLRPVGRSVKRVDSYHEPSLSPNVSIKLRGDTGRLESKVRSHARGHVIGGVHAVVERWQKWRLHQDRPHQLLGTVDRRRQADLGDRGNRAGTDLDDGECGGVSPSPSTGNGRRRARWSSGGWAMSAMSACRRRTRRGWPSAASSSQAA